MIKYFFIFFIFFRFLFGIDFKIATYNVENFFDLKYDGTEYNEYRPNTKYWNKKIYQKKLNNIAKVIKELNANILALQEVESQRAFKAIVKKVKKYKYHKFIKNKNASIGLGILSQFPIIDTKRIIINKYDKYARDILRATIKIKDKKLIIYVNHWRSKRASESKRIKYALALKTELHNVIDEDYILLGDFNENYNEFLSFRYNKKLNDTYNLTGINHILNTIDDKDNFITKENILKFNTIANYNLWLELPQEQRFSSKFKDELSTPDNIIIGKNLFDNQNISYIDNSFGVFKPKYLYNHNKVLRWNQYTHKGFSDHLPIYAYFSTKKQKYHTKKRIKPKNYYSINTLYKKQSVYNFPINNVIVIYKTKKLAIIKQKNSKAIMIYKPQFKLKIGKIYNIIIGKITTYNGLKEITNLKSVYEIGTYKQYKKLYLDPTKVDITLPKYQNEIVSNLKGIYKKGYLYFRFHHQTKKIKLYFTKKIKRPTNNSRILIKYAHRTIYKSKQQITIYDRPVYLGEL